MSDNDLEKMINASGIAKVKKVKEIRNYSSMEDFDPKDFRPDDKIIVTKKPMSNQFHGESSQKNEANGAALLRDMKDFKKWMDTQHKNHPGYYKERKDAINTVIDLLEELYV